MRIATRAALAPDARVDDGEVHGGREVRHGACEHESALRHRLRRDPVRDVDDLRVAGDPLHHAPADADEVVLQPEVGQERDVVDTSAAAYSATAATSPSRSWVFASPTTSIPTESATLVVSGPIETAGAEPPTNA